MKGCPHPSAAFERASPRALQQVYGTAQPIVGTTAGCFGSAALAKAAPAWELPSASSVHPQHRQVFAETWPPPRRSDVPHHANPFANLNGRVRGMAKQWRERVLGSPPKTTGEGSGADENLEPTMPRLQLVVKPFGKDGVRVGWQRALVHEGESLLVESQLAAGEPWLVHSAVESASCGGKPSGTHVVKHGTGQAGGAAPAKRAWRVRSSAGDVSSPHRVGDKRAAHARTFGPRVAAAGAAEGAHAASSRVPSAVSSRLELPSSDEALMEMVRSRVGEVGCLLRVDLCSEAGIVSARRAVVDALALDDELHALSERRGLLKGHVFQALLEALRAQGTSHAQLDNSCKQLGGVATPHELGLSLLQWSLLCARADALRNLVRVKVADDNDLRTARLGLLLCRDFFAALEALATQRGTSEPATLHAIGAEGFAC